MRDGISAVGAEVGSAGASPPTSTVEVIEGTAVEL